MFHLTLSKYNFQEVTSLASTKLTSETFRKTPKARPPNTPFWTTWRQSLQNQRICIAVASLISLSLRPNARGALENAFFVVWRARFIALFIGILKFIRDFIAALIFPSSRSLSASASASRSRNDAVHQAHGDLFYSFPKCTRAQFIAAIKSA